MTIETDSDLGDSAADAFFATAYQDDEGKTASPPAVDDAGEEEHDPVGREALVTGKAATESSEGDPDDAELEWGEGEKITKAKLRDLKEAFQKRAEVDSRSTAVTAAHTVALQKSAQAETALQTMVSKAEKRWAPYASIDFLALSRDPDIDQATFAQIRSDAQEALTDYQFLTQELSKSTAERAEAEKKSFQERANACANELRDPQRGIPGFDNTLYTKMVDHAVATYGAPKQAVLNTVEPWALKILHDAMLYRQGAAKVSEQVTKVVNRPTRVMRPGASQGGASSMTDRRAALQRLRDSGGDQEAAADAFFATSRRSAA